MGLFLHADNLPVHGHYLRPAGVAIVNASQPPGHDAVDADRLAALLGEARAANLVLLGYAAGKGVLFAGPARFKETLREITPEKYLDRNIAAFQAGLAASR